MRRNPELDAFRRRAITEGNFTEYKAVVELQEKQAQVQGDRPRTSPLAWIALAFITIGVGMTVLELMFSTWWSTTISLACIVGGGYFWLFKRPARRTRRAVLRVPPTGRAGVDMLGSSLPSVEAKAVFDAITGSKQKLYRHALDVEQIAPPGRSTGKGADLVIVPLPGGQITRKDIDLTRFAAAVGVETAQVRWHPKSLPSAVGIDVLHTDPATIKPPSWPGLKTAGDWTAPFPLGIDAFGSPMTVNVADRRVLVAGKSGFGKTVFMRMVALWAVADPNTKVHLVDMKMSPALRDLKGVVDTFHNGVADEVLKVRLERIRDEMRERYAYMDETGETLTDHIVLIIDEAQDIFRQMPEVTGILEDITRQGREANVGLVIGSQTPDKESIPRVITDMADVRVALHMQGRWAAGIVVGDETVDLTVLPRGHAFVKDDEVMQRVATYYVDNDEALQMTATMNTVPAVDRDDMIVLGEDREPDLLDEIMDVIGSKPAVTWRTLTYALDMSREDLRPVLRDLGIPSMPVRETGASTPERGIRRADVALAIERRDGAHGA